MIGIEHSLGGAGREIAIDNETLRSYADVKRFAETLFAIAGVLFPEDFAADEAEAANDTPVVAAAAPPSPTSASCMSPAPSPPPAPRPLPSMPLTPRVYVDAKPASVANHRVLTQTEKLARTLEMTQAGKSLGDIALALKCWTAAVSKWRLTLRQQGRLWCR